MTTKAKDPYIKFLEAELKKKKSSPKKRTIKSKKRKIRKVTTKKVAPKKARVKKVTTKKVDPITSFFDRVDQKGARFQKNISKIESRLKNISVKKGIARFKSDREREEIERLKSDIAERKRRSAEKKELAMLRKEAKLLKAEDTRQRAISGLSEYRKKKKAPSKLSRLKKFSFRFRR